MKIGDRVLIKGIVDEIRKDVVIIKNDGGYFGTVPSEIIDKYAEQEPCEDCDYSEIMDWEQDAKTGKAKPIYWCERHKEPKTGKWKFVCQHWRKCSECGFSHKFAEDWNYCPNCGAKMVEPQEGEKL